VPRHDPLIRATDETSQKHAKALALSNSRRPEEFFPRLVTALRAAKALDRIVEEARRARP
jgi:hypothetical protein